MPLPVLINAEKCAFIRVLIVVICATWALSEHRGVAQSVNLVKDGSFENLVGTADGNGYILWDSGSLGEWTYTKNSGGNGVGKNTTSQPFAQSTGALDGDYTLFIQRPGTVSQTVTGLTPGEYYTYSFKYDARNFNGIYARMTNEIGDLTLHNHAQVNTRNPFYDYQTTFRAESDAVTITFSNTRDAGNDSSLLIDAVSMTKAENNPWWYSDATTLWTDDATSRVDSAKTYTHTLSFNSNCTLNGVRFEGVNGATVNRDRYTLSAGNAHGDGALFPAGTGSNELTTGFVYNVSGFSLSELMPGLEYTTTLYLGAWSGTGNKRIGTIVAPDGSRITLDEQTFRNENGRCGGLLTWTGVAPEDGTFRFNVEKVTDDTFHIYGVSNEITPGQVFDVRRSPLLLATNFGGTNGTGNNGGKLAGTPADIVNFLSHEGMGQWQIRAGRGDNLDNYLRVSSNGELHAGANCVAMMDVDADMLAGRQITMSVDVMMNSIQGSEKENARGVGLGFSRAGVGNGRECGIGFSGLVLRPDGALMFYENAFGNAHTDAVCSDEIAYHGIDGSVFNKNDWHTLDLLLDVAKDGKSATLLGATLSGSDADYSALSGSVFQTLDLFSILSSSAASWDYYALVDNLRIGVYVPEPSTWVLFALGAGMLWWRKRK